MLRWSHRISSRSFPLGTPTHVDDVDDRIGQAVIHDYQLGFSVRVASTGLSSFLTLEEGLRERCYNGSSIIRLGRLFTDPRPTRQPCLSGFASTGVILTSFLGVLWGCDLVLPSQEEPIPSADMIGSSIVPSATEPVDHEVCGVVDISKTIKLYLPFRLCAA